MFFAALCDIHGLAGFTHSKNLFSVCFVALCEFIILSGLTRHALRDLLGADGAGMRNIVPCRVTGCNAQFALGDNVRILEAIRLELEKKELVLELEQVVGHPIARVKSETALAQTGTG